MGLEIVVSTKADGTMVGPAIPEDDPFVPPPTNGERQELSTSSRGGSTQPSPTSELGPDHETESHNDEGEATPKATKTLFDDNFGSSPSRSPNKTSSEHLTVLTDLDQDFFSFSTSRSSPFDDPEGANSSNVSNALSLLERSFGKVSLSDGDQHAVDQGLSGAMTPDGYSNSPTV